MIDPIHLHPMIVHFPIALLIVGFLFDVVGLFSKKEFFSKAGFYLLFLGALGVIAAYITGNLAGEGVAEEGPLKQAIETHEDSALLTLWLVEITAVFRLLLVLFKKYSGWLKYTAALMFLLGMLSVARTGYFGGELVFKHAAGVKLNLGSEFNSEDDSNSNLEQED